MLKTKNTPTENILILGLGGIGFYLAKRLIHEGYAVTAIESNNELVRYADGNLDARIIRGNAMSIKHWQEADAGKMNLLIAVTDNDAVNMMASMIAHQFGVQMKIARVRSLEFGHEDSILTPEHLHIDLFIHPEELAAQEIVRLIKRTAGNEIIDVAQGELQVMATRVHEASQLANKNLITISQENDDFPFRVVAIARGIKTIIPGGKNKIMPQDQILIMASRKDIPRIMELTGEKQDRRHRVMILGGGLVGSRVAELLGKSIRVKLIEKDEKRADELSFDLKYAEVLHGDGSEMEVLTSAGMLDMDTLITATGENETNIMSSLLAKHLMSMHNNKKGRQRKTIALVNKEDYLVLAASVGSDIALNKKILAGNEILKFIRRGRLLSVAHLHGFDAEVVEIVAAPDSPITRKPLSKLDPAYFEKILIGGVFRDGNWQIAVGDTHIQEGERVIVVCTSLQLKEVQALFFG